ncbi:MAG: hypothetical protein LBK77_01565 [Spirochaetaceae bacterium]|jgi:hypothetical protein|nr:hypothetical protein [Spirochaetaceae bacterium]
MRKIVFVLALIILQFSYVFAGGEEEDDPGVESRYVLGAGFTWANNPRLLGGHFDFGIVLYRRILYIQNDFLLRAGGLAVDGSDYSVFTLSDKIIFGRNSESPLKIYTYFEGGLGIYGNDAKQFFADSAAVTFGFGGGGEISSEEFGGLYFEVGYLGQKTSLKYPVSGVILQTGWRIFF